MFFLLLHGNHDDDLVITDTLPSVYASLIKAVVYCTCDTHLWHFVLWL